MASSTAAQIMQQANTVKETLIDSDKSMSELWVSRQKLEDLYKRMLLLDLEYALDKKVEQELWNHAFKNQISTLQSQAKDRMNPKKSEAQANLNLFLETASGFYLQFLQMICSTFKLDVPFRRKSVAFGMIKENTTYYKNIVTPKKSSCLYICCHCLVHLGDIARYRQQTEQAQTYYRHAANLSPNNGQPYNQIAILEASRGDKLSTVFYYVRSLAVRHPFPVAATNLEKFYSKLIKDTRSDFDGPNLTLSEIITAFLQFQALLHMATNLERASNLKLRITTGLGSHIRAQTVTAAHLTGMVAVSVFGLHRARQHTSRPGSAASMGQDDAAPAEPRRQLKTEMSAEEEQILQIHLAFTAKLLETMLVHTPKEDNKARDFLTLSAIKVIFDWLYLNKDVLSSTEFHNTSIWSDLCKLLNTHQWLLNDCNKAADKDRYEDTPLSEDLDLRCFQPLEPTYSSYNYSKCAGDELSAAVERDLRCQRLVAHGRWLANDLPALRLLSYQPTKSIRNQFSTQKTGSPAIEKQSPSPVKQTQRKNIAMQTILKKQQQKQMEQDKGLPGSALTMITEDVPAEIGRQALSQGGNTPGLLDACVTGQGNKGRSGMITIPHKGNNHKNLPPRLSAKAGGNEHNKSVSPRLQKKFAQSQRNSSEGHKDKREPGGLEHRQDKNQEVEQYPGLDADNYPALVSSRPAQPLALASGSRPMMGQRPPGDTNVPGSGNTSVSSADGWPGFMYGSPGGSNNSNSSGGDFVASSVGRTDATNNMAHSSMYRFGGPPPPPPLTMPPSSLSSNRPPPLHVDGSSGGNHPTMISPRLTDTHTDFLASLQNRQQQQMQQQQHFQLFQQQQQQQQQKLKDYQQQQNQHKVPMQGVQHPLHQQLYQHPPPPHHQQQQPQHKSGQQSQGSTVHLGRQFPGAPSSQGGYHGQAAGANLPNQAPVGFIPPPGPALVPTSNKPSSMLISGQAGNAGSTYMAGNQPPTSTMPPSLPQQNKHPLHHHFMQQPPHHYQHQQQQQHRPAAHSGLLYQNIPLPGAADASGASVEQDNGNSQDARLSSSFQGHAAGTPKPDKQQAGPGQFYSQAPSGHGSPQIRPVSQQPSMLRSVMGDPPFLQAGGEYTLFSGGASPAWNSSLGKAGHTQSQQHGSMPVSSQLRPGGDSAGVSHAQSMWSASGPSPLERLLEQQKNWKQTDG